MTNLESSHSEDGFEGEIDFDPILHWERAAGQELGLAIRVSGSIRTFTQRMYAAREGRDDLKDIRICHPNGLKDQVWLVKKTVEVL